MDTDELLRHLEENPQDDALELLNDIDVKLKKRFNRVMKSMRVLIDEVREVYPDANYYVNDDDVSLMLGHSHSSRSGSQPYANHELSAVNSIELICRIGGGGW